MGSSTLAVTTLGYLFLRREEGSPVTVQEDRRSWWLVVAITAIVMPVLGWLFRAQSYVLGDGYALIANLQLAVPIIKARNFGGYLIPLLLNSVLPGSPESRAQLAYQLTSIGCGLLYVVVSSWAATVIFEKNCQRVALFLLLLTSGNMLLFFGYAENYPLFHVLYLLACALGYRSIRDQRPGDIVLFALAVFAALATHIFAVTLIPAALGLFLPLLAGRLKLKWFPGTTMSAMLALVVSALGALAMYVIDDFARMSFLPIFPNEFTTDSYTLFSLRHLADTVNLIVMLIPGILVLLVAGSRVKATVPGQFLLFVGLTGFALAFWVNPWLGMPRDWDLLSFWIIPMVMWVSVRTFDSKIPFLVLLVVSVVLINCVFTVARITSNNDNALMLNHNDQYFANDPLRNMKFRISMANRIAADGDTVRAEAMSREIEQRFPEINWTRQSVALSGQGRYSEAVSMAEQAIRRNPMIADAYNNIASAQIGLGQLDAAQRNLEIAAAFNPYNTDIFNNLAAVAYGRNRMSEAEKLLNTSIKYQPENIVARLNLLRVALSLRDSTHAKEYAQWLRNRSDLSPQATVEIITSLPKWG